MIKEKRIVQKNKELIEGVHVNEEEEEEERIMTSIIRRKMIIRHVRWKFFAFLIICWENEIKKKKKKKPEWMSQKETIKLRKRVRKRNYQVD